MTMPEPQVPAAPEPADAPEPAGETFASQLLAALRSPEVEDAVRAAAEHAEIRNPRQPPPVGTSRFARRA